MNSITGRPSRRIFLLGSASLLASCGLPRSGPNKREIFSGSVLREGDAYVLTVDDRVNRIASLTPALGFSASFENAGVLGSDTISPGDKLGLTIFENVDTGLLAPTGAKASQLTDIEVDGNGNIFVPYAGTIHAAGNSPTTVQRLITEKLQDQTPSPQVMVRRVPGDGSTVSIVGAVGGQGVYPIERPTRTLSAMIAKAGGVTVKPEIAQITLIRGNKSGSIWFEDLYNHPGNDIALRNGDRIVVQQDTRSFTALGATGSQSRVSFQSQTISAIEAIAQVGGLTANSADPTGVFVFRNEPEEIARQLVGDNSLQGAQRVIYVLDLTKPNGMFMARDFSIRDKDTVYVTEAPFTQFNKTIAAITGTLNSGRVVANAATAAGL
ncbi:MAG: polysaccharide export protein [Limimaricola sp.]|uniref:polysaccharide biosynthesis/export family protein n=1 Tax=Limimaricola sp. TaxID=2211665 RepID=UPI001DBA7DFC|nr:polysaccharide biosynthesis/export family protein [Limimaricola sp.]MBI1416113.1 polysaccharide export protein [Limimaricola sp.]